MSQSRKHGKRPDGPRRAAEALEAYRRRTEERGLDCLLTRAASLGRGAEPPRRRSELVEEAMHDCGLPWRDAETLYALSLEEGVEPAFAFELVRCGIGVARPSEPDAPPERSVGETPDWVAAPPPAAHAVAWERKARQSFRRLRALLETHESPEAALAAFAEEPDVEETDY